MHLGIDATNIRSGGGVTHLAQMLSAASLEHSGVEKVTVWTNEQTASKLPDRAWLVKVSLPWMKAGFLRRIWGQQTELPGLLQQARCDLLFSPGGTLPAWAPVPTVVMSQNMLPFEPGQALLFGRWSPMRLKMRLLRASQGRSFKRAGGLIFLTEYARNEINRVLHGLTCPSALVPHGIEPRFSQAPRQQRFLADCTSIDPFRLLYVSVLMPYKHQVEVAQAVAGLRAQGVPLEARFVGTSWGRYGLEFARLLTRLDPGGEFLKWSGYEPFESLHKLYQESDAFIFASSCENLPNILVEAMASGLPIACSDRGPMPEVLKDAGVYFDPDSVPSVTNALLTLMHDPSLRERLASNAWQRAQAYSWQRCADETLRFLAQVFRQSKEV